MNKKIRIIIHYKYHNKYNKTYTQIITTILYKINGLLLVLFIAFANVKVSLTASANRF